ncbi:MAG: MTAP family purine nucleoside phosphorylase [Syntrophales bacterium]|nr:MTAP family purine nucleoside phosphorylase [Syntrophales bacterium]
MEPLGIIAGSAFFQRREIFGPLEEKMVENEFGQAIVFLSDTVILVPRHGKEPPHYILPHLINHQANLRALRDFGVREVIGINSTGSLRRGLKPGTIVVPHDFIMLFGGPTIFSVEPVHITPVLSEDLRQRLIDAAIECGFDVVREGIYWQTRGPRLETKAEIAMMSQFADLVGMTMASEAVVAKELDVSYAALCSVDNYGHGLGERELTMEEISQHAARNAEAMTRIITSYMERRKG